MPRATINSQSTNLNVDRATFVQEQSVITETPTRSRQNIPTPSNIQDEPNNDDTSLQEQSSPSLAQAMQKKRNIPGPERHVTLFEPDNLPYLPRRVVACHSDKYEAIYMLVQKKKTKQKTY